jgi:uncharacterized protein Yka (UPF0111/DUF47 family)
MSLLLVCAAGLLQPIFIYMGVAKRLDLLKRSLKENFIEKFRLGLQSSVFLIDQYSRIYELLFETVESANWIYSIMV